MTVLKVVALAMTVLYFFPSGRFRLGGRNDREDGGKVGKEDPRAVLEDDGFLWLSRMTVFVVLEDDGFFVVLEDDGEKYLKKVAFV